MDNSGILEGIAQNSTMVNGEVIPDSQPTAEQAPETETVETEKEESVKEEKKEDVFSKKFAALSKKERQIRQREQQLNAKMAQLEEKLKSLDKPKEEVKPNIPIEKRLKQNPLETLKELGLSYEKITELALNDGKISVDDRIELLREEMESKHQAEIEAIRNELLEKDKKTEEEKYKEVIQNFMVELTGFVNENEDYELIRANDAVSLVYDVIQQHHANSGRVLSNKEAADHVEAYLLDEAQKLLKLKKLGYKEPVVEKKPETQTINKPTLSNNSATTLSNKVITELKSDAELKKAAASMLKWD